MGRRNYKGEMGSNTRNLYKKSGKGAILKLGGTFRFQILPAVYYLNVDGDDGFYFTATGILTKKGFPLKLESTINQTFRSDIPGNKDFLWNATLSYYFERKLART